jgi:hypothetical protein
MIMKSTKLIATVAFTGLMAIAGGASAVGNPHDAYNNAFFGDSGGRANENAVTPHYATSAGRTTAVDGHAAYNQAFHGGSGLKPQELATGKAAYGASSSGADGHAAYSSAFRGD